jgi:hypothetical protein
LVVFTTSGRVAIAAELKAWDIGHQLFDLAKVCCLLTGGVSAGLLISVARRQSDFDRLPGGELFPAHEGEVRAHDFVNLIMKNRDEWRRHVGKGGPEPTTIPTAVTTTAVAADTSIDAYPGHSARVVEVGVSDPSPIALMNGWPELGSRPL